VAAGDLLSGPTPAGDVVAMTTNGSYALSGTGGLTLDPQTAGVLIVAATTDDGTVGLFSVHPSVDGVCCRDVRLTDQTRRVGMVDFTGARAERLDPGSGTVKAVSDTLQRGAVSLAAEMIGGAQKCLDMTLAYVKERYQFGSPIGRFQAIKHRCADLALSVDTAREAVHLAAEVMDRRQDSASTVVAAAKMKATEAYLQATSETIQLHGGIGFTWEHDAHLYYKRALVSAQMLGTAPDHRSRLADELGI
jgi:alkylation response protein AidB-like acyl-CoA dehydrogenase